MVVALFEFCNSIQKQSRHCETGVRERAFRAQTANAIAIRNSQCSRVREVMITKAKMSVLLFEKV
jgi:hypothetical protein